MNFIETQQVFMAHIRAPEAQPKPGDIEDRRMAIYRDLFFNNINGFISSGFPVLKTLYCDDDWVKLVRRFFAEHDCQSPFFLDIAGEFIYYLSHDYVLQPSDPVFMLELAHYEWIELDVSIAHTDSTECAITDEVTEVPLYMSSCARNLSYQFAVQHISADFQPQQPSEQPHYFVVYRDTDDEVQFLATNAMTALLLAIIDTTPSIKFASLVKKVALQAPQFTTEQLVQGATATLCAMVERGIIVTKNHP
ncbi:HvfC family RiPP maturation protein [Pseudoalteromonas ostreae]|uniref:HvfC family RiPP maturation protein n=1 Tax=Pseudoalteromonas ostreae TaxID=2774154 RepID=UPI001B361A2B|nr:putative DNA-binding domain-containing protein [Pseudoalteromonas ostreae]